MADGSGRRGVPVAIGQNRWGLGLVANTISGYVRQPTEWK